MTTQQLDLVSFGDIYISNDELEPAKLNQACRRQVCGGRRETVTQWLSDDT